MNKKILGISAVLLLAAGVGVGRWVVPAPSYPGQPSLDAQVGRPAIDTSDYDRTLRLIKAKYVKTDVTDEQLFYGSVAGLVEALDDPYSVFLDPKQAEINSPRMTGSFSGIGAELGMKEGRITIIAPIADTPAAKAGLQSGDVITAVDGKETYGMKVDDVVLLIRGEEGKPVKLTIYREGDSEPREITVVRAKIVTVSVKWKPVKSGKKTFMLITISQFSGDTLAKFKEAAADAMAKKVDGLIIDLRNDPGGMLNVALEVIGHWDDVSPGVIMEPRGEDPQPFGSEDAVAILAHMPTVVLVNKGSASASEITAGALQDFGKARVIGETTYGKGCGQTVYDYPDGAQLRLTTFLWKTPKGRTIDKTGITPDEVLKADPKDIAAGKDVQLDRAIQFLSTGR